MEPMHHRMRRHDGVAGVQPGHVRKIDGDVVVGPLEHEPDQIVGMSNRPFEVVAAPARAVEAAVGAGEWGHGRSSTEIVPVASSVTSR
jgi:hypothetical protein